MPETKGARAIPKWLKVGKLVVSTPQNVVPNVGLKVAKSGHYEKWLMSGRVGAEVAKPRVRRISEKPLFSVKHRKQ